jgi:heat shock protein HslJ
LPRHTRTTLLAALPLVALLASACGDDDDDQASRASLAPVDLTGTRWVLSSYVADDSDVATSAVAALDFGADGVTLNGSTGCNVFNGTYTQDGDDLSIELGPMTLAACADEAANAQERAILDGLARVVSFTAAGQLALLDEDGVAVLLYDANTTGLEGTSWTATGVNNGTGGVESTALTLTISAAFAGGGALSGFAGCNRYNARYETSGSEGITITDVATTRMACAEDVMTLESQYTAALAKVTRYSISGATLTLRDADGATQVTYAAAS